MLRRFTLLLVLATAGLGLAVPSAHAGAGTNFVRSLSVTGTGAAMYPDFDRATARYAVTTDATTGGAVTVSATTSDPTGTVLVDGARSTGPTQVTGLSAGDEVSVIITDGDGTTAYSVMYLPAGFPKLTVTTHAAGLSPELVALTLNGFEQTPHGETQLPAFEAIVDRNGVPVYAAATGQQTLDLKQQPSGELTISRATTTPGHTGTALVTLDDQLQEASRIEVHAPLTNTDGHDAVRLADGSTVLLGYEPNSGTGLTDATIQKIDANGNVTFSWNSSALADETVASAQVQGATGDYAHVNSVQSIEDDDLLVSFRHLSAVLRIATVDHDGYHAGDIIWKLGGRDSSFSYVDDPLGGTCGQHTASELPNGHILVFDNGTSGLCVDQSDPTGATLDRGATRISEYALDLNAHTATLVWSYAPPSTYAFFAGSARRLADGDTLIGWADYRGALATEVDDSGTVVWNMTAPAGIHMHKPYATYRAEPITSLPDAIDPTVATTGAADHVVVAQGASVAAGARCADRGGSNLTGCAVTGLVGGRLDTTTTGTKHWTVVATDGAGNQTTVERTYTVRTAVSSADAQVRTASAHGWTGVGVHGGPAGQTVLTRVRRGHHATGYLRARNDGERTEALVLRGTGGTRSFTVHYFAHGKDVTRRVVAGTYRTGVLAPGASEQLRVVVTPHKVRHPARARTFVLRCAPASAPTTADRVGYKVVARR